MKMTSMTSDARRNELPSVERLNELFRYEDGELYWKLSWAVKKKRANIGDETGYVTPKGYMCVRIDGVKYLTHRIIWKMIKGEEPPKYIDHINQNKLDNRIENLRAVTQFQNLLNNKAKGCYFNKEKGKWQAQIMVDGKHIHLGYFDTEEEAIAKYQEFKALYMEMKIS